MSNLFNPENAFFTFMGKLCDMIMISLLYVILCIPLVTIGPATAALYYTMVKVIRRERGYVSRAFFHSLKENFKVGLIASIFMVAYVAVMIVDYQYAAYLKEIGDSMGNVFTIAFNAILIIALFIFVWIYPVLSRFKVGVKQLFKNALLIAIRHFPSSILLIAIFLAFALGTYFFPPILMISPALCALLSSFLIERVLKKYTPKQEGTPEETGVDEWYNE